jgi:hypothetical protein
MSSLSKFCRQIQNRSIESQAAIPWLCSNFLYSPAIAILRQELDSLIRLEYLLSLEQDERNQLIEFSVTGKTWTKPGTNSRLTDKAMVEGAGKHLPWSALVYKIGCSFIHLSNLHDYQNQQPVDVLSKADLESLIRYVREYHGGVLNKDSTFEEFFQFIPEIFQKGSKNVERRIEALEKLSALEE